MLSEEIRTGWGDFIGETGGKRPKKIATRLEHNYTMM